MTWTLSDKGKRKTKNKGFLAERTVKQYTKNLRNCFQDEFPDFYDKICEATVREKWKSIAKQRIESWRLNHGTFILT